MSNPRPTKNDASKPKPTSQGDGSSLLDQVDFIGDDGDVDIESFEPVSLFDQVIGHIEDIMVDDSFQELQNSFFGNYSHLFSEDEENKLEYTNLHAEYVAALEQHLERELASRIENFSMDNFAHELTERRNELEGEVFEMLFTITDFAAFKEAMLDYKRAAAGEALDVSMDLIVMPLTARSGGGGAAGNGNNLGASSDMEMASPAASLSLTGASVAKKQQPPPR